MIGLATRSLKLKVFIFKFTQKESSKSLGYQYKNSYETNIRGYEVTSNNKNLFFKNITNKKDFLNKCVRRKFSTKQDVHLLNFEKVSTETLESLGEYFDEIIEEAPHLQDADVSYGDGVLTIKFGSKYGTYVINRQVPNQQIWLSSPTSGPKRYDFVDSTWIYKHDGKSLHELLNEEIPNIVKFPVLFSKCSYSIKDK